jgi:hypothetical protein
MNNYSTLTLALLIAGTQNLLAPSLKKLNGTFESSNLTVRNTTKSTVILRAFYNPEMTKKITSVLTAGIANPYKDFKLIGHSYTAIPYQDEKLGTLVRISMVECTGKNLKITPLIDGVSKEHTSFEIDKSDGRWVPKAKK